MHQQGAALYDMRLEQRELQLKDLENVLTFISARAIRSREASWDRLTAADPHHRESNAMMQCRSSEKFNPHPGGDISHAPTTDGNLYIHKLQDYTCESRSLHSDPGYFQVEQPKKRPLAGVRVAVRVRARAKIVWTFPARTVT